MNVALSLFAVSFLGADAPAAPPAVQAEKAAPVVFQMSIVEMNGLDWRSKHFAKLSAVADRDGSAIWTAPSSILPAMLESSGAPKLRVKLVAESEKFAHVRQQPNTKGAEKAGIVATLMGRKLDQGVLAKLAIEDTSVVSTHLVPMGEGKLIAVPEMAKAEVAGEWLIPQDGVLIVSLGIHTVADTSSKAVVKERLVLVEANPLAKALNDSEARNVSYGKGRLESISIEREMKLAAIPMPFAAVPSRSLPEPRNVDGQPLPLPPLPIEPAPPTTMPLSSEPCAAPQAKVAVTADSLVQQVIDRETKLAGFSEKSECEAESRDVGKFNLSNWYTQLMNAACDVESCDETACTAETTDTAETTAPTSLFSFRSPKNGLVSFEIRVTAGKRADAPLPPPVPAAK